MVSQVKKRDGSIVLFNKDKITRAILKAMLSVSSLAPDVRIAEEDEAVLGGFSKEKELAKSLAEEAVQIINSRFGEGIPSVEEVQDVVEGALIKSGYDKTAKAYIIWRNKRAEIRKAKIMLGVEDDFKLSLNSIVVLAARYLRKDENGKIIETPREMFKRVAKAVASVDGMYGKSEEEVARTEREFYEMMASAEFMPNSPTLMNAGANLGQLSACFVLQVGDSMEEIFESVKQTAIIHKTGGGTGISFSRLRPRGDAVKSTSGVASGPISFMTVFDKATDVVKQGGKRRGANMGVLRVDHPDILDFIMAKEKDGVLQNFNISVAITDRFMEAVIHDRDYELINPRNGKVVSRMRARAVWNLLITIAWKTGDPGVLFIDRMNSSLSNPVPHLGPIESTNPCVIGSTLVSTEKGLIRIEELAKTYPEGGIKVVTDNRVPIEVMNNDGTVMLLQSKQNGTSLNSISRAFCSGVKEVYRLTTKKGFELTATPEHKIFTTGGWVELKDCLGKEVLIRAGGKQGEDEVVKIIYAGKEKVYDLTEPVTHSMICNSIVVHQCGEQPLYPYDSCNLGSINLCKMIKGCEIDWDRLGSTVRKAIRFLDNVIDANRYPIKEIEMMTKKVRRVGLGVMGFADMLIQIGVQYNSEEALKIAEDIMKFITSEARKVSAGLGRERGSFPEFERSVWKKLGYPAIRNSTVTTIAPTGTISIIAGGCSQGIEPLFSIVYMRNVSESIGSNLIEVNPLFERIAIREGFYSEELIKEVSKSFSIQHIQEIPERFRKLFVTAHEISPAWHVRMQAAFQKYTDNAVSKTINFPNCATPHDVEKVYLLAYKVGCKGITTFRDGSKSAQVLTTVKEPAREKTAIEIIADKEKETNGDNGILTVSSEYNGGCSHCTL